MSRATLIVFILCAGCKIPPPEKEVIREATNRVFPSVVFIKPIQKEFRGGEMQKIQIFGSGVIISEDGIVVTNNHVAEKATAIKCVLSDREELSATVIGLDPETDLAVLQLDLSERKATTPLPKASFGKSTILREGDLVLAMGAPHGLDRSVSRGIVSSMERYFTFAPYNLWIQTDAAINPGNSGGPLVNIHGEIIGINARAFRGAQNLGFAIPSKIVKDIVEQLIANKKVQRAWTGIRFQALKDFTRSSYIDAKEGVLVASVDEGSPAVRAGLQAGDIVISAGKEPVHGMYEINLPAVERLFASLAIDVPVNLRVKRGSDVLDISITPTTKGKQEGEEFECERWDMTVKEISKFSEPGLHFRRSLGVYVLGLKSNGNARAAGLTNYDILLSIGESKIETLEDVRKAYEASLKVEKGKRELLVRIIRGGYRNVVVLNYEKDLKKIEEED